MTRRDLQVGLLVLLAVAAGFAAALLLMDDNKKTAAVTNATSTTVTTGTEGTTTTSTATGTTPVPASPQRTTGSCIQLWNEPANRAARTALAAIATQQPVRIHVGTSSDVPPECLITVIANNGDAYVFAEGGGATYPYAPTPGRTTSSSLPAAQRSANALEQGDGALQPH